jgi:hypothetical protein
VADVPPAGAGVADVDVEEVFSDRTTAASTPPTNSTTMQMVATISRGPKVGPVRGAGGDGGAGGFASGRARRGRVLGFCSGGTAD